MIAPMQGRIGLLLAGAALAIGGGVAGAVVVAPDLGSAPSSVEVRQAAEKEALASLQHTFKVAKKARGMARGARALANGLVTEVDALEGTAAQALAAAGAANTKIDATQIASDTASGRVQTNDDTQYLPLGGPQVTVNVPQSGYIEVWASATFGDENDTSVVADGAIALFEDGQLVPISDQQEVCTGPSTVDNALISGQGPGPGFQITLSTPPVPLLGLGCGSAGSAPGSLVFKRPPGTHTYELRYVFCGCGGGPEPAAFSNRVLQVAPRL